jgi:hypothetical protein
VTRMVAFEAKSHEVRKCILLLGRELGPICAWHAKRLETHGAAPKMAAAFGAADASVNAGWVEGVAVDRKGVRGRGRWWIGCIGLVVG